jgi:hypothetical protein
MGFKSGLHTAGGQGTLAHRRKELQEAELQATLEAAQINEAQRLAQESTPACMRELKRMATSHAKQIVVSEAVRLAAIRLLLETAWGKPSVRESKDGGTRRAGAGGRRIVVNINTHGAGVGKQVRVTAMGSLVAASEAAQDAEYEEGL